MARTNWAGSYLGTKQGSGNRCNGVRLRRHGWAGVPWAALGLKKAACLRLQWRTGRLGIETGLQWVGKGTPGLVQWHCGISAGLCLGAGVLNQNFKLGLDQPGSETPPGLTGPWAWGRPDRNQEQATWGTESATCLVLWGLGLWAGTGLGPQGLGNGCQGGGPCAGP